jgi:hypothetical protein
MKIFLKLLGLLLSLPLSYLMWATLIGLFISLCACNFNHLFQIWQFWKIPLPEYRAEVIVLRVILWSFSIIYNTITIFGKDLEEAGLLGVYK